ncbi:ribosomal RNA-processing 7 -like protein [Labeo rohita]|uniref:Ribosomal RNA-processing 7-like protein n=1 Tax=Labeo rohita TaxID=84645 RepID=A0A498MIJ6_LABRO|nr:ribosomal RNA-processing 7 -like protein [Labeo rohita]RXN37696.1 ribosomal RNA-processing 7 -like protein [Labeo rohita]
MTDVFGRFGPVQSVELNEKPGACESSDSDASKYFTAKRRQVTKGSRGVKARPHSETANERTLQKEKKKKERKELLNFYTWQHRNTQKQHIAELRKKFEEDKQRIAVLRAQRKFRPY